MPDNINEDALKNDAVKSDAAPAAQETAPKTEETPAKPHTATLAEASLESSLSDVLPLSPIAGSEPAANEAKREKKNERRGLRRGNSGNGKSKAGNSASGNVGVVENPAEFKETLSGTGPKPRREREPRRENGKPFDVAAAAAATVSPEKTAPAVEVKPGSGWSIEEKKERNYRRNQPNAGANNRPKLFIEPAPIPEQEAEPSFWERLKTRILAFFKVGRKKNKKRGNKRRGGKFRNDNNGGKDFRHGGNGKRNFNRNRPRNSNFRGGYNNRGNARPHNGGEQKSGE